MDDLHKALKAAIIRSAIRAYFRPLISLSIFIKISPISEPTAREDWIKLLLYCWLQYNFILYTIVKSLTKYRYSYLLCIHGASSKHNLIKKLKKNCHKKTQDPWNKYLSQLLKKCLEKIQCTIKLLRCIDRHHYCQLSSKLCLTIFKAILHPLVFKYYKKDPYYNLV